MNIAHIMVIGRHRLKIDGFGVTTLVCFASCPLRCKYCLNAFTWDGSYDAQEMTTEELYEVLKIDDLYFQATNGGVTFGGGEPYLHRDVIKELRGFCGNRWNITLETCLNVPLHYIMDLIDVVDSYIIDIKDMNPLIYKSYTGGDNRQVIENLKWLVAQGKEDKICVRVPLIPKFNEQTDVDSSVKQLKSMGITNIDVFEYRD